MRAAAVLGLLALPPPLWLLLADKACALPYRRRQRYKDSLLRPGSWGLRGCAAADTGATMPCAFPIRRPWRLRSMRGCLHCSEVAV